MDSVHDGEKYYQVVRFDLEGRECGVHDVCMSEQRSRVAVDQYNATPGAFRLRRREVDLSRLARDAFGEFE